MARKYGSNEQVDEEWAMELYIYIYTTPEKKKKKTWCCFP